MTEVIRQLCTGCNRSLKIKIDQVPPEDLLITCPKCQAEVIVRVSTVQAAFDQSASAAAAPPPRRPTATDRSLAEDFGGWDDDRPTRDSDAPMGAADGGRVPENRNEQEFSGDFGPKDLTDSLMNRNRQAELTPARTKSPAPPRGSRKAPRNAPRTRPGTRNEPGTKSPFPFRWPASLPPLPLVAGISGGVLLLFFLIVVWLALPGGSGSVSRLPAGDGDVSADIAAIQARYPNPGGEAAELFREGMRLFRGDSVDDHVRASEHFRRALAAAPHHPEPLAALAMNWLFLPRSEREDVGLAQASRWAEHVHKAMPDSVLGGSARAALLVSVGQLSDARTVADATRKAHGDSPVAWFVHGHVHEESDPRVAAESFRRAISLDPGFRSAETALARAELRLGRPREARMALESRHKRGDPSGASERVAADLAVALGDEEAALERLERAVALEAKDVGTRLEFGWRLAAAGELARAGEQAARVLEVDRPAEDASAAQEADAHLLLAEIARRQGNGVLAAERAEKALAGHPRRTLVLYQRGLALSLAGQHAAAAAALQEAARKEPGRIEFQIALGNAHTANQSYGDASAAFQAALALDARDPLVRAGLASLYARTQLPDRAMEEWDAIVSRARPLAPVIRSVDPRLPRPPLDHALAIRQLRAIEATDPNRQARYRLYEGAILAEAGRLAEAVKRFAVAGRLDSSHASYVAGWSLVAGRPRTAVKLTMRAESAADRAVRGWALMAAGSGSAEAALKGALRLDPGEPFANLGMAQLLVRNGRQAQALPFLQAARSELGDIPAVVKVLAEVGG